MKVVVEAGSSKTDFALLDNNYRLVREKQFSGMNPVTDVNFDKKLTDALMTFQDEAIDSFCWYGTGCISDEVNSRVAERISAVLKNARIEIYDDLLGAARGIWQDKAGIIAILGTGSNAAFYNGENLAQRVKSCGYLLGDEGSGFRIGQKVILGYIRELWPPQQQNKFEAMYKISRIKAITSVYEHPNPRSYLASFSTFLGEMSAEERMAFLDPIFTDFVKNMVLPLADKNNSRIGFVGSIAYHFQYELSSILRKFNILATSFEKSPLKAIIRYHHGKGN